MIAKDQNLALLTVGKAASTNPEWIEYAFYCFAREKGLRKDGFNHLSNFLNTTNNWNTGQKIEFVKFVFPFFETIQEADYGPFPQPLSEKLVKPTLEYWCENERNDERPFRWYGTYYSSESHLFKALELNPQDDLSRQQLLIKWADNIYHSIHHLPEGYIGDPQEDLELAEKIKHQISQLADLGLKDKWINRLEGDLVFVRNYLEWEKSGHPNFEQWGIENKKMVSYGIEAYYYNK